MAAIGAVPGALQAKEDKHLQQLVFVFAMQISRTCWGVKT